MGGQETDVVVMQRNLNARRHIDDVLCPHAIPLDPVLLSNMTIQDLTEPNRTHLG